MDNIDQAINNYGDINTWNVSSITNMVDLFAFDRNGKAMTFNSNISNWDTSNVVDMSYMFYGARSFNQNIRGWTVSSSTNVHHMFRETHALEDKYTGTDGYTDGYGRFQPTINEFFNQESVETETEPLGDLFIFHQ